VSGTEVARRCGRAAGAVSVSFTCAGRPLERDLRPRPEGARGVATGGLRLGARVRGPARRWQIGTAVRPSPRWAPAHTPC